MTLMNDSRTLHRQVEVGGVVEHWAERGGTENADAAKHHHLSFIYVLFIFFHA